MKNLREYKMSKKKAKYEDSSKHHGNNTRHTNLFHFQNICLYHILCHSFLLYSILEKINRVTQGKLDNDFKQNFQRF